MEETKNEKKCIDDLEKRIKEQDYMIRELERENGSLRQYKENHDIKMFMKELENIKRQLQEQSQQPQQQQQRQQWQPQEQPRQRSYQRQLQQQPQRQYQYQQKQQQYQQGQQHDKRNNIGCMFGSECKDHKNNICSYNHASRTQDRCIMPDCESIVKNSRSSYCYPHNIMQETCETCNKKSEMGNIVFRNNDNYKKCNNCQ